MNIAFIPVRGGSKSIPLKNIKPMAGHPLVYWTAKAACECRYIDKVYICTDSLEIKRTVDAFIKDDTVFNKIEVVSRSLESASDTASTEFVMLEFTTMHEFDNIALIQATSPLLDAKDLEKGFDLLKKDDTDSVMSVVRQFRFNWAYDIQGNIKPTNYDVFKRPRRQEFDGYLVENGAFYITSRENLIVSKNRVSGNIKAVEMSSDTFFEIDEPSDWTIIESLLLKKIKNLSDNSNLRKNMIKMLLTDVDGCLTDGGMYYSEKGDELKKFNTRDGMAFKILREHNVLTGIVTSEDVKLNRRRAKKLKLDIVITGCKNKAEVIKKLSRQYDVPLKNICYIGDDINDIESLQITGLSCCPNNAEDCVRQVSNVITESSGGKGVIREIVNCLLKESRI